ncbi:MAG: SLBB domain-containing protein [Deltaproteobacteria bacterium]|nr:SLBB domain-containing protein [Deltaproteobacteria bacterium]
MRMRLCRQTFPRLLQLLLLLLIGIFLVACASDRFEATTTIDEFQKHYEESQEKENKLQNRKFFTSAALSTPESLDYRLGPGDLISVTTFEAAELNADVRVSSRGTVTLPMLGAVDVFRLTAVEAEKKIELKLKEKYLQDPHVSVYIKEGFSRQITLVGALKNPGTFDYIAKKRLLDVLALAGGLEEGAGEIVYITRENSKTGEPDNYVVDLDELVRKGNMKFNITILGGDIIFVPQAGHCFISGAVRKPGIYPLKTNLTITEAIALAGGLANYAEEDDVKLIRYVDEGKRDIVRLSFSELQEGQGDTIFIQDQDVIFVELSGMGTFVSGSGFSLGFMGTGFNYKTPIK